MNIAEVMKMYSEHAELNIDNRKVKEDNFFDIGTRGNYENPFTEILAYLLDSPNKEIEKSNFLNAFLTSLLEGDEKIVNSFMKSLNVDTQQQTQNGNFIDMILYNQEYAVALENKIDHILANPLTDYEEEIKRRFPKQEKIYFVFSKNEIADRDRGRWINMRISEVFNKTEKSLRLSNTNKWDFFIFEFVNHHIEEEAVMTDEEFKFCTENYPKIIRGNQLFNEYIELIINKIDDGRCNRVKKEKHWGEDGTLAIRFYPQKENNNNSVIILRADGKFSVSVYFKTGNKINRSTINDIVGGKYRTWNEGQWICFTLLEENVLKSIDESIDEVKKQIENIIKINLRRQS